MAKSSIERSGGYAENTRGKLHEYEDRLGAMEPEDGEVLCTLMTT